MSYLIGKRPIFSFIQLFTSLVKRVQCKTVSMSFLESFNLLSKWTQIFGFNNFTFPTSRTGLKIRLSSKILTALKMSKIAVILVMNNNFTRNISIKLNGIDYSSLVLSFFACSVLFTNLYIELRYRHRIWSIISGLCEIDSMVCRISNVIYWTNYNLFWFFHSF